MLRPRTATFHWTQINVNDLQHISKQCFTWQTTKSANCTDSDNSNYSNHRFTAITEVNLFWPAPPVKNWKILLVQSVTDRMPLLAATSAFALCRRHWRVKCLATSGYPDGSKSGGLGFKSRWKWEFLENTKNYLRCNNSVIYIVSVP